MSRLRTFLAGLIALFVVLTGLASPAFAQTREQPQRPSKIVFTILSAEGQASSGPLWQPLLDDLQRAIGIPVEPVFGSNYSVLVEAMSADQAQIGWFSALPAVQAIDRAGAEVIARTVDVDGKDSYTSSLIVKKGSGITVEDLVRCGKQYDFGIGDAQSTSGTLAPMTYFFSPRNISPAECFATVRSASHQANLGSVANGVLDVATNNTEGLLFATRENPAIPAKVQVIWTSPPLPESSILVRKDLDPAIKAKLLKFFTTYGSATGAQGEHERQVLKNLTYGGVRATDDSYLDPIRLMVASDDLSRARRSGDAARIATSQKAFDAAQALAASRGPGASSSAPAS